LLLFQFRHRRAPPTLAGLPQGREDQFQAGCLNEEMGDPFCATSAFQKGALQQVCSTNRFVMGKGAAQVSQTGFQIIAVAAQKLHQTRTIGASRPPSPAPGAPAHGLPLRSPQPAGFVSVAVTTRGLAWFTMPVIGPAEPFGGLFLHAFLHHQLGTPLGERLQWVGLVFYPVIKHLINLLVCSLAWWYSLSIHGVWFFLQFRAGELGCPPEWTIRRLILQEYIDITSPLEGTVELLNSRQFTEINYM